MEQYYPYIKSLHLIFIITWFAGLFYIVRLFVYQIEASQKPSPDKEILGEQLKIMASRLWNIITWPSMILALFFGIWLISMRMFFIADAWMQVKLAFVVLLILYQFKCHQIFKQLQKGVVKYSSNYMRLFNEVPTIILFSVVFLVILKDGVNWIYGTVGIIIFAILLMMGYKIYKRIRESKNSGF
ncbi:putative membrane protein [Aequorivita sublithincola DSM 14238]|uniref:Protoporphyrinogen IX oxidase n=1 Tax=Aequorivita sublithincola (strain DSM 14238 / LMG 21431 / ACAM 643 / 9-3) TaxID=746697 RepID=I3YUX5_AEQSU|nr:CopD family protein [Aequorivita sublithincola]AFL80793.1 putative membrane protein [Aequorivita sublithincola DSM 14238]